MLGFGSTRRDAARARELHRDSPWLWREDWAAGRIPCSSRRTARRAWVFALFWNAVSLPLLWVVPRELERGNLAALVGLLFSVVGVALLVWAVRSSLHLRRFGASELELDSVPGVVGGDLSGTVHVPRGLSPLDGFRVKLVCVNRVTRGYGKNRRTTEYVRWQEERAIGAGSVLSTPFGTSIPVSFAIPYACEPSSAESSDSQIVWRLEAEARVPGIDFRARFDVPVFKTERSRPEAALGELVEHPPDPTGLEARSGITIRPDAAGGQAIDFAAARNPRAAIGLTLFTVLWTGIVAVLVRAGEPFFSVVFGAVDLVLLYGTVALWFGRTQVRVRHGTVEIRDGIFRLGAPRAISAAEVEDVRIEIRMQAGSTPYYDVRIALKEGRTVMAGQWIRSKRDAEAVARVIETALGRGVRATVAPAPAPSDLSRWDRPRA